MLKSLFLASSLVATAFTPAALANWQLDNSTSELNFVSIKKNQIAETHHFKQLSATLSEQGTFKLAIDLSSIESLIPIRNERMQKMLFDVAAFPKAEVSASLAPQLKTLQEGVNILSQVPATLSLHGKTQPLSLELTVVKIGKNLLVSSRKPVLVQAASFDLVEGIDALRVIAGLDTIATAVPVNFTLQFYPE